MKHTISSYMYHLSLASLVSFSVVTGACKSSSSEDSSGLSQQCFEACQEWVEESFKCSYGTNNYYSCQSAKDKAEHELCELGEFDCSTNAPPMSDANNQSGADNSFHCDGKDIPFDYVCDAYSDCSDGEDEEDCLGSYACNDGTTIQSEYVCDGLKDCPDNSDEKYCEGLFTCKDDGSIPEDWLCDNEVDCAQGDDESVAQCFVCDYDDENSQKYRIEERCDGHKDCINGWDEEYC